MCISMLATAVGQALTKYVHDLLDLMFNCGLSEPLVSALANIEERIKPLSPIIQGEIESFFDNDADMDKQLIKHRSPVERYLDHLERSTV